MFLFINLLYKFINKSFITVQMYKTCKPKNVILYLLIMSKQRR